LEELQASVDFPAIFSDLSIVPGERFDVPHLHHGSCKINEEGIWIGGVEMNLSIGRTPVE